MAKGSKKARPTAPAAAPRSVLSAAWTHFENGDVVEARRLAEAALNGQVGPDDEAVARTLAPLLSTSRAPVSEGVVPVAEALLARTRPLAKAYWFAVLALSILSGLVLLAVLRT